MHSLLFKIKIDLPHICVSQRNCKQAAMPVLTPWNFDNIFFASCYLPSDFRTFNGIEWDPELPEKPYLSQHMLNQCTGIGQTGGLSTTEVQSALVYRICCTHVKPHSNFWIETGTLTNRERLKKSTVISPGVHNHDLSTESTSFSTRKEQELFPTRRK